MPRRRLEDPPATAPGAAARTARARGREAGAARREVVLEAAQGVFLRYGFKKTSMDDLARAAGVSRQGLYLHFQTKEALFKAVLEHTTAQMAAAGHAALVRDALGVEDRLVAAFEAFHGSLIEPMESGHIDELFETAEALVGPLFDQAEREFAAAIAAALAREGIAAAWKAAGISAKELADHLCATSTGIKHTGVTLAIYRARMRTAVKIVARGAPR